MPARERQGTPFPFEGPVPPALLIDRHDELAELARRAADRVNVRLVAPRRFGKTSLLAAHAERLVPVGWRTAHVDLSRVTDLTDVARRLAGAYGGLDPGWVRAQLPGLLGRIGVSLTPAGPGLTVGVRPQRPDADAAEAVVLSLLDLPKTLFERDAPPTLGRFDEFQGLLGAPPRPHGLLPARLPHPHDAPAD